MEQTLLLRIRFALLIKKNKKQKNRIILFWQSFKNFLWLVKHKSHFDIKINFFHLRAKVHAFRESVGPCESSSYADPWTQRAKELDLWMQRGALGNNHDQPGQH